MTNSSKHINPLCGSVVGIDVAGKKRGFHAVAMRNSKFIDIKTHTDPAAIVNWCIDHQAAVVAVDAPCKWSKNDRSRLVERELAKEGISCFATPSYESALANKVGFYDWVFNGQRLYQLLLQKYHLFDGNRSDSPTCVETFPHAVACSIEGKVVINRPKGRIRREALKRADYDDRVLPNIDFVDAALCAITADACQVDNYKCYGDAAEGFIVIPKGFQ